MEDRVQNSEFRVQSSDSGYQISNLKSKIYRSGFTLVEMLTVIIIIGILAGLITAAAVPAIRRAREAVIRQEITQLEIALEKYKQERGDYPPDFAGVSGDPALVLSSSEAQQAVLLHFRKAFPRYTPGACDYFLTANDTPYVRLLCDISYATRSVPTDENTGMAVGTINLNPATALVFMLGGPPAHEDSSRKLLGFSANPANPFAIGGSRLPQLYEFDETRVQIKDGYTGGVPNSMPAFIPPHMPQSSDGSKAPYVYFRPRNQSYFRSPQQTGDNSVMPFFFDTQEQGICTPYADTPTPDNSNVQRWMEPTKFQIICAGLDGLFREPLQHDPPVDPPVEKEDVQLDSGLTNIRFLSGEDANILPQEDDNITNFTQGKLADRAEE